MTSVAYTCRSTSHDVTSRAQSELNVEAFGNNPCQASVTSWRLQLIHSAHHVLKIHVDLAGGSALAMYPAFCWHSSGPTTQLQSCRCSYDLRELTVSSGLEEGASGVCRLKSQDGHGTEHSRSGGCGIEDILIHLHDPICI